MNSYLSCEGVMASGPRCRYFDKDWIILSGSLLSEISDKGMKLKEKVADKIFWNKNGSVSLGHFLAFSRFPTFLHGFPRSVKVSLSDFQGRADGGDSWRETGGICSSSCVCIRTKYLHIHHLILAGYRDSHHTAEETEAS